MIHNRDRAVRVPWSMILLFKVMNTSPAENKTSQPASQNWPMDSSGLELSSGTMCPVLASVGKSGRNISAVCVDIIVVPLGFEMEMGFVATRMLLTGVPRGKKWDVQPVSPMEAKVVLPLLEVVLGGPIILKDE